MQGGDHRPGCQLPARHVAGAAGAYTARAVRRGRRVLPRRVGRPAPPLRQHVLADCNGHERRLRLLASDGDLGGGYGAAGGDGNGDGDGRQRCCCCCCWRRRRHAGCGDGVSSAQA